MCVCSIPFYRCHEFSITPVQKHELITLLKDTPCVVATRQSEKEVGRMGKESSVTKGEQGTHRG